MITGGFGMTFDIKRGVFRQWYLDKSGVKRWVDNSQPVDESPKPDDSLVKPAP